MTAAALFNGYALNDGVRFTFIEGERASAGAAATGAEPTRVVPVTGRAISTAQASGVFTRLAYLTPASVEATATAPRVDAWRVTTATVSGIASGATASGVPVRTAWMSPERIESHAEVAGLEPLRLAQPKTEAQTHDGTMNGLVLNGSDWQSGTLSAWADTSLSSETLATRLVKPGFTAVVGEASLAPLAYDLTRWMNPRQMPSRAISHAKEKRLHKLKVRQQYAEGMAIGRAHTRGTPNTILAFSITYATADASLASSKVLIARDAVGVRTVAEASSSVVAAQDHAIRGTASATATLDASPDITSQNGARQAFAHGQAVAEGLLSPTAAIRLPMVQGVRQPAEADLRAVHGVIRDAHGRADVDAASLSDPLETLVTHSVWMKGTAQVEGAAIRFEPTALRKAEGRSTTTATTTGEPWHWRAIPADGVAQAIADAAGENPRIITRMTGTSAVTADMTEQASKLADATGQAKADGATLGEAAEVARRMQSGDVAASARARPFYPKVTRPCVAAVVTGQATTTGTSRNARVKAIPETLQTHAQMTLPWADNVQTDGARALRWIGTDPQTAVAKAGISHNVFLINAGAHASPDRSILVPFTERFLALPESAREYLVQ